MLLINRRTGTKTENMNKIWKFYIGYSKKNCTILIEYRFSFRRGLRFHMSESFPKNFNQNQWPKGWYKF